MEYSREYLGDVVEFMRRTKDEFGQEFGDELAIKMLDALDPNLKHKVLMELLLGNIGPAVRIKQKFPTWDCKKIACIKAVRKLTGYGLKEAKQLVDGITESTPATITGQWARGEIKELISDLDGTGYEVL